MGRTVIGPRRQAREAALQILYFWEVGKAQPDAAIAAFFSEHAPDAGEPVVEFASALVHGTIAEVGEIDALISRQSEHWRLGRLAILDRLILRMAVWELRREPETAPAVVLNEAIELARRFSSPDSVRFVNGVLDGIRKTLEAGDQSPDLGGR
jgi:transcription antitermination protein NusB